MLIIIGVYSFFIPSIPNPNRVKDFKVTQSQTIYFKNIRAYFYEKETLPNSGIDIYRFKKILEESELEKYPIIVHNWRHDEAYILFEEKKRKKPTEKMIVEVKDKAFTLENVSTENHTMLAIHILPYLYNEQQLTFDKVKAKEKDKALLRQVINDYLKWIK